MLVLPFNYLCIISLCCITVTVLSRYSNVQRADIFLRISLFMFADLFYILVDKSSKKPFNFLRIQFEHFGFFFVKTVLLLESSFKDNQPKKGKWDDRYDRPKIYFRTRQKHLHWNRTDNLALTLYMRKIPLSWEFALCEQGRKYLRCLENKQNR